MMSKHYQSGKEGVRWVWEEWKEHGIGRTETGPMWLYNSP